MRHGCGAYPSAAAARALPYWSPLRMTSWPPSWVTTAAAAEELLRDDHGLAAEVELAVGHRGLLGGQGAVWVALGVLGVGSILALLAAGLLGLPLQELRESARVCFRVAGVASGLLRLPLEELWEPERACLRIAGVASGLLGLPLEELQEVAPRVRGVGRVLWLLRLLLLLHEVHQRIRRFGALGGSHCLADRGRRSCPAG